MQGSNYRCQFGSKENQKIAISGILVERAINRIKNYKILKSFLPITVPRSCGDIIRTCAGLCDVKPFLFKNYTTME